MKRAPRSLQHHVLYRKYNGQDSEISALLGKCGLTPHGLVIEFQHSRLSPEEQAARESFYSNMVWVVDGTRLPSDLARFMEFKDYFNPTHLDGIAVSNFPGCFPSGWSGSKALVAFDFAGEQDASGSEIWCLFPGYLEGGRRLVAPLPRGEFVRMALEQSFIYEAEGIRAAMAEHYRQEEALWFGRPPHSTRYGPRR